MTETQSESTGRHPPSVQPGGGICMSIELAWGKIRRAWLRTFRPGYIQRMAELRQGECPDCPHEIIDPRDLKYWRNVCGHSFRPEDDRFQWRNRLGFARYGLAELLLFTLLFLATGVPAVVAAFLHHWAWWIPFGALLLVWLEIVYFYRDPNRRIPVDPQALVSPADGTVTNVEEVDEPDFSGGRALRISIFLSIFNVHVNRIPRSGHIVDLRYFPGEFLDARNPDSAVKNEQLWIDMEEPSGRRLRVKQISGAVARRIVCWLKKGDDVQRGEKLGMIKLGSRTDILVPTEANAEPQVTVGDKVKGGSTVLMLIRE